jgi:hypothetical protein
MADWTRHRTGFTEEGENTGPDHRTDTQESSTTYSHGTLTLLCVGWVAGIRSAAYSHAFTCRPMRPVQTMLSQIQPLFDIQRYGDTDHPASPAQG